MTETTITLSPDVLYQDVSGEAILLDLSSDRYFGLNPVGASAWRLLQAGAGRTELVERLLEEYDIGREELESDIHELLEQLAGMGLVRLG